MNNHHFPRSMSKQGCKSFYLSLFCFLSIFVLLGTSLAAEQSLQTLPREHSVGAEWPNYEVIVKAFYSDKFLVEVSCPEGHQERAPKAQKADGKDYDNFFLTRLTNPEQNKIYFCIMPLTKFKSQPLGISHYYDTAIGLISKQYSFNPDKVATVAEEIRQAMYFGYGCLPNPTLDNYFATQIYIWDKLGFRVTWGTAYGIRNGDLSWYPAFRSDLERRKNAYLSGLPSFAGQNYDLEPGQETILTDDKQVLESVMLSAGFVPDQAQRIEGERGYVDISWIYPNSLKLQASEDFANSVPVNISWGGPSTVYCLDNGTEQAIIAPEYNMDPNSFSFTLTSTVQWLPPTPTASLTIQKLASQVVDWERLDLGDGLIVYQPIYEERGLADVRFRLRSIEDVVTEEGLVPAGEFSLEFTSDEEGKAHFTDLPCVDYILEEIRTPAGYMPSAEPISLTVIEDADPTVLDEPFVIKNDRIPFSLKAFKVLQDVQDIDPAALEANIGQMHFGLELTEDFANAYTSLPAGSLVSVSGLTDLANPSYVLGERPGTGERWTTLELTPPFPGHYKLVELNPGAYHQAMEALELDLSNLHVSAPLADGTREMMINFPLYNQRIFDPPADPVPEPEEVVETDPQPLPSSAPPQIIVEPHIQNSAPPINLEITQVAPDPAPVQTPPIQVGSYVEKRPDNANLAVQLPRTGAADIGAFSTILVFVGAFLRGVYMKLL